MKATQTDIINDLFDLFHIVLEGVKALPQSVVLQIQQSESGMQICHKMRDAQRASEIAERDRIGSEAGLELKVKLKV